MYSEKTFNNYIFWTKVRRVFLILLFSIIGCLLGVFVASIINTITTNDSYRIIIIALSTLVFFALSLILTIGTAREVQDAYWKMAVLRKLTVISKKLNTLGTISNVKNTSVAKVENQIDEADSELIEKMLPQIEKLNTKRVKKKKAVAETTKTEEPVKTKKKATSKK